MNRVCPYCGLVFITVHALQAWADHTWTHATITPEGIVFNEPNVSPHDDVPRHPPMTRSPVENPRTCH